MTALLPIKDKSEGAIHLKIAAFRKDVRRTAPHKHYNYFETAFLSAGSGYHLIDHQNSGKVAGSIFHVTEASPWI